MLIIIKIEAYFIEDVVNAALRCHRIDLFA